MNKKHSAKKIGGASDDDASVSSLRAYAKRRILNDMVDHVRKFSRFSADYLILVFDNAALKVFSSCCQLWELISISKIYHIEKLECKRKRFRKTDAIYFISPNEKSIECVVNDFKNEADYMYGAVHLCFTSHVSDELLVPIAKNKHLAQKVASFSEINLDFYMFNDSVFHLNMKNTIPIFKLIDDDPNFIQSVFFNKFKDDIAHRLLTVCTVYDEFPDIQYQGDSELCKSLAG